MANVPFTLIEFIQFLCTIVFEKNAIPGDSILQLISPMCAVNVTSDVVSTFTAHCQFIQSTDSLLGGMEKPCSMAYTDPLAAEFCQWWQNAQYPNVDMYQTFCPQFPNLQFNQTGGMPKQAAYLYLCKWNEYTKEYSPRTFEGADCDLESNTTNFVSKLNPDKNSCQELQALTSIYVRTSVLCSTHDTKDTGPLADLVCGWWNDMDGKLEEIVRNLNLAFCEASVYVNRCGDNASHSWYFHAASVLAKTSTAPVFIVAFPILLVVCTLGNVFSLIVFASQKDKRSAIIYLMAICVFDFLHMWFQIPRYIATANRQNLRMNAAYDSLGGIILLGLLVSKDMSDWSLTVFCIERSLALLYPLRHSRQATATTALTVVSCILAAVGVIYLIEPLAWYYQLTRTETRIFEFVYRDVPPLDAAFPPWIRMWEYCALIYRDIKIVTVFVMLMVADVIVLVTVYQRQKAFKNRTRKRRIGDLNVVVILSTTTYLLTQGLTLVNELLMLCFVACLIKDWYSYAIYWNIFHVQNVVSDFSHSFNFLFYARTKAYQSTARDLIQRLRHSKTSDPQVPRIPLRLLNSDKSSSSLTREQSSASLYNKQRKETCSVLDTAADLNGS